MIKAIANPLVVVIKSVVLRHPASIVFPDDVFVSVDGEAARVLIITVAISEKPYTRMEQIEPCENPTVLSWC